MGNRRRPTVVLLAVLVLSLLISGACRRKSEEGGVRIPPSESGEIKGDLAVSHVSPEGAASSLSESGEILVVFDHPMAPLAPLPLSERTRFLRFEPDIPGVYRWMGTRTVSFAPEKPLPFGTTFKATVPAGTRSLDGYVLKEDKVWEFATPRPRLIRTSPENKAKQQTLAIDVLLVFNQPMEPRTSKPFIDFIGGRPPGTGMDLGFSLSHPSAARLKETGISAPAENALLLSPSVKLETGTEYTVLVREGLPGAQGKLGMEKSASVSFSTFDVFDVKGLGREGPIGPTEDIRILFTNRVIYKDLVAHLRFEPKADIPEYYSTWDHGNTQIYLSLDLAPETKYTLVIDAGLKDAFGNVLGRERRLEFSTTAYPPMFQAGPDFAVVESARSLKYPFAVRNVGSLRLMAVRLPPERIVPLLAADGVFDSSKLTLPAGGFGVDRAWPIDSPRNKLAEADLDLEELLGARSGFLFVQLDTFSAVKWSRYPKVFLQATDLGLSGKFSPDNNVIWVTGLQSGRPVAGAEVEIRDGFNAVRWRGRTGEDGRVESPGWKLLGIRSADPWSKPRQWVIARKGDDAALLVSDWGTGLYPYRFGIDYDWSPTPEAARARVFTERGIYRAGETVHVKGVARTIERGAWRAPAGLPVDVEVRDPFRKAVRKETLRTDPFGSFAFDVETREDAPLGSYEIAAKLASPGPGLGPLDFRGSFRVEAYRPAEFEVHLRSLRDSFVFGDVYKAELRGAYLFGGAMSGQKARWSLRLNPIVFDPPGWSEFRFGEPLDFWAGEEDLSERSRLLSSGEGTLGPDGLLAVEVPLVAEKEKGPVSATLEATVQGPSRRSISNRIDTVIHRGTFYLGLKPASTLVRKGETLSAKVVAVTPEGAVRPETPVTVTLIKREWRSVRRAGAGGRFEWVSEVSDTEVAGKSLRTGTAPVEVAFSPDAAGVYVLRAVGTDPRKNEISSSVTVYLTGRDYVPWERTDDDKLELVAAAASYKPGDMARILVKSPYESAMALVTVERESVRTSEVLELRGSANEIAVPITAEHIPNVFVSVLLVQGRTAAEDASGTDVGKPSFKLGYLEIPVDAAAKRLAVDVMTDKKKYRPGEKVGVKLVVRDAAGTGAPASVAVAVVDLGVLNLIGYQAPDLHAFFYGPKPLGVQTAESRIHVVGERSYGEKGENAGGGGARALAAPGGLSEVALRGDFRTTVFWNPSVLTDDRGEAAVEFSLPDNLTTFRVMAVAQTRDSLFGRGQTDLQVAKPLLMLPSLPRFARVGDAFKGGIVIHNNGTAEADVALSLDAAGINVEGASGARSVRVVPGGSAEVLFGLTAERMGTAVLSFRAASGPDSDGIELRLPILQPRPTESTATYDSVSGEPKEERLALPRDASAEGSRLDLQASASALAGLSGSVERLTRYPYLCLEQRMSSILPYVVADKIIRDFHMSPLSPAEVRALVTRNLREAYACQKDSGGFGLWPDSLYESPFVSAYTVFALLKAGEAGYAVDGARLDNALRYLRNLVQARPVALHPYPLRSVRTVQAYALYLLALSGRPEPGYNEKLFTERDGLPVQGRAWLFKALHLSGQKEARDAVLRELLNLVKITPGLAHFEERNESELRWIYSSNVRATAVVLQALLETRVDSPFLAGAAKWLVAERRAGRWSSTQDNFFVFHALNDYYRTVEGGTPDFRATVTLAGTTVLEETFRTAGHTAKASIDLAPFAPEAEVSLKFSREGTGIFYYGARLTYARSGPLEPRDEGFAVYKKIETLDGKPAAEVKAGSLIAVTLEVAATKESLFVVVDDPLPAGFEAVNAALRTESEERQRELGRLVPDEETGGWSGFNHVEMRDDRVLLFADSLRAGTHRFRYLARALAPGSFSVPGSKAEEMYAPEVFGRSVERTVKIVK